jgi:hypothetical protein
LLLFFFAIDLIECDIVPSSLLAAHHILLVAMMTNIERWLAMPVPTANIFGNSAAVFALVDLLIHVEVVIKILTKMKKLSL